jgi:hypothetical protein
MAITTLDGIIAGMQPPHEFYKIGTGTQVAGKAYSLLYAAGYPAASIAPTPGMQGAALTSYPGQLDWTNPSSGNSYLARLAAEATTVGTLWLCDRLWHNSGNSATSTGTQTSGATIVTASVANPTNINATGHGFTNGQVVYVNCPTSTPVINDFYTITWVDVNNFTIPVNVTVQGTSGSVYLALPPRDNNGSRNGTGVYAAYEVNSNMGAGTPNLNVTYVDSVGTAGSVSPTLALTASMILGTFIPIPLAAGDVGVRGIQSHIKNATQNSGGYSLVLYRVLARIPIPVAYAGAAVDAITSGMPRLFDNTVPFLVFIPGTTTSPIVSGQVVYTQG